MPIPCLRALAHGSGRGAPSRVALPADVQAGLPGGLFPLTARLMRLAPGEVFAETIREWSIDATIPLRSFAVCSDIQVGVRKAADGDIADIDVHDLEIPLRPSAAAHAAVAGRVRRIPLGRIEYEDFNGKRAARYFTVAAGIGVDAHLFYKLTAELKSRSGMAGYYLKAWHLWATHKMRRFEVEYSNHDGARHHALLTELLAVRIRYFGNILRELVPGASLDCDDLRVVMARTASRNAYLRYVAGTLLGRQWKIAGIDLASCSEIVCRLPRKTNHPGDDSASKDNPGNDTPSIDAAIADRVYVEADGELLGRLPARMTIVRDALSLVVPASSSIAQSISQSNVP